MKYTEEQINQSIEMVKFYKSLGCTTFKELAEKTYKLRKKNKDILYVTVDGIITPLKFQTKWEFLYNTKILDNERLYIRGYKLDGSVEFIVYLHTRNSKGSPATRKVFYNTSGVVNWELITGVDPFWVKVTDDIWVLNEIEI